MSGPYNKGTTRVHLPDTTATTKGLTISSGPYPCFDGYALLSYFSNASFGVTQPPYPPNISTFPLVGIGVVALTGNEFLWYSQPYNNGAPLAITAGFQFAYGQASVSSDGVVTRGPVQIFHLPFSPGIGFTPGDGYSCILEDLQSAPLLDVAPGGKFLFGGSFYDSAGIAGLTQNPHPESGSIDDVVIPETRCDALFLVTWNGSSLVLSAQTHLAMEPAFLTASDSAALYAIQYGAGVPPPLSGEVVTKTSAAVFNPAAGDPIASGSLTTTGWGAKYWTNVSLCGACFCGDSILIGTQNTLFMEQLFELTAIGGFVYQAGPLVAGYLVTADASTLAMSPGVDITSRLVGTSDFPDPTTTFAGAAIANVQNAQLLTLVSIPPTPPFPYFGVVSSLVVDGEFILSLDRVGYDKALVQIKSLGPGGTVWYYGATDATGTVSLTRGQFLATETAGASGGLATTGFARAHGAGGESVRGFDPFYSNSAGYNPGEYGGFPTIIGDWRPQRHYWAPGSPDEVFGVLTAGTGLAYDPSSQDWYATSYGVLRADVGGVPTFDFLDWDAGTSSSHLFAATPFSIPPQSCALQSGSAGTYNLTGYSNNGTAAYYLGPDVVEEFGLDPLDLYAHGTVTYSGGVATAPLFTFAFEWNWVNPPWVDREPLFPGSTFGPPTGNFPLANANAVTLQTGQVVFAARCGEDPESFYLYAGKLNTFSVPSDQLPRGGADTTPTGTRVRKPSGRVHLPDNTGSTASRTQSPRGN